MTIKEIETFRLFGVPISIYTKTMAISLLEELVSGQNGRGHGIFFVNANVINIASQNALFKQALAKATAVFPDGVTVRLTARLKGHPPITNLPGTNLIPTFLENSTKRNIRVFLLGGTPDIVSRATHNFSTLFPRLQVVGSHHGYFTPQEEKLLISNIKTKSPQLLLVGMGSPKQEMWILRHQSELGVPLCIAVGGLFKYWAGTLTRAPLMFQRVNLEWLWILIQEPQKWHICLRNAKLVGRAIYSRFFLHC